MRKLSLRLLLLEAVLSLLFCITAFAGTEIRNETSGFTVSVCDDAGLLSETESETLIREMMTVSEDGNAAFYSNPKGAFPELSAEALAEQLYRERFGAESGVLFLIDMEHRKVCLFSDGQAYEKLTGKKADVITDNVYGFASDEKYGRCAAEAFRQTGKVLRGERIAQPMKYICNALLALITSLLAVFTFINNTRNTLRNAHKKDLIESVETRLSVAAPYISLTGSEKAASRLAGLLSDTGDTGRIRGGGGSGGGFRTGGGGGRKSGGGGSHKF